MATAVVYTGYMGPKPILKLTLYLIFTLSVNVGQQSSPPPLRLCVVCQEKAGRRMWRYSLHVNSLPSSGSATDVVPLSRKNVFKPGCKVGSGKILLSCSIRNTGVHVCCVSGLGWSSVWGSHLEGDASHTGTVQVFVVL